MRYDIFSDVEGGKYKVAILVPKIKTEEIVKAYFVNRTLDRSDFVVIDLFQAPGKKKTPMAEMREYITQELQDVLDDCGVEYILCGDSEYFKAFTKQSKAEPFIGYPVDSQFGKQKVFYIPNYQAMFYNPEKVTHQIKVTMDALQGTMESNYKALGSDIIKVAAYPDSPKEIKAWLDNILAMKGAITLDIEGFSLKHWSCGIGTVTLCWNQHEGIAFPVDYHAKGDDDYGVNRKNLIIRKYLKDFLIAMYKQKRTIIYHNIAYDAYALIYQLFMDDLLDQEGLHEGLKILLTYWDCTKLISYLATNSCAGNDLSLKTLAHEYAGNYAQDEINDITKIPKRQLLTYNLTDGLATWYVFNKNHPIMVYDQQNDIYNTVFKPAMVDIIQMQLTGLPVDMEEVKRAKVALTKDYDEALTKIQNSLIIKEYRDILNHNLAYKANKKYVKKRVYASDFNETFNPNSGPQIQEILYEFLQLPVIAYTESKAPSCDADTLKSLKKHTDNQDILDFLDALLAYKDVEKILSTFIPALEGAQKGKDGWHYLFGNFNLGGTVSGRLSSSKPNLQNLPSTGTKYAKILKKCFKAPPGWLFCGLDFDSLEDRISALTTKDPMKLKVYTDGYDGHCLRAYAYFKDQMTGIDPNCVKSINSIADVYKHLRQESKVPTFALTYAGTYVTLMANCGFTEEKAKLIEQRYHELYVVSDTWVDTQLDKASKVGYITAAFGLRVRTPLLHQVIRGTSKTPYQAQAEGRTAGNALGQSWCLLNSRAGSEFMGKVRKSKWKHKIKICAQIHDANYFLIPDDIEAVMFTNEHLVNAARWQNHPDIYHPDVKLGGTFFVCFPDWSKEVTIPNGASEEEIVEIVSEATGG